jgi:hypothetical protein
MGWRPVAVNLSSTIFNTLPALALASNHFRLVAPIG